MSKVAFLGGGSFGISLAILLANKGNIVSVYDRDSSVVRISMLIDEMISSLKD